MHYILAAENTPDLFKAKADDVCTFANSSQVINSAIKKLINSDGIYRGSIFLMAGDYDITDSIVLHSGVEITGASMQETKLNLKSGSDCFVTIDQAVYVRVSNLLIYGENGSGCGINGNFKQSTFERIRMIKMNNTGIKITPPENEFNGMLNIFQYNDINVINDDPEVFGIDINERNYDSWIINNNIGSKNANIRVSGGPFRITGNHCNGTGDSNDQPLHNLVTSLGLNSTIISNNIFENARTDAMVFSRVKNTDSGMLGNNLNISNNLIRSENLDSDDEYSMIKFEKGNDDQYFNGITISGNLFEQRLKDNSNSYKHSILLDHVKNVVVSSNVINLDGKSGENILKTRNTTNVTISNNSANE